MGRVEGKVALVTGAARGMGRAHAAAFAREGATVIATDICEQIPSVAIPMATPADLEETVRLVEVQNQECMAVEADARDADQMQEVVDSALQRFGKIDIVVANHGIVHTSNWETLTNEEWRDQLDTNLVGVWNVIRPVIPGMIESGGGSIIITASVQGLIPLHGLTAYVAAKHGVIGLMRGLSADLGQHWIRVNAVCPAAVDTPINDNEVLIGLVSGGKENATYEDTFFPFQAMNLLPSALMPAEAVSDAVLFLACQESKYITGVALPVDAGHFNQPRGVPLIASQKIAELEHALAERDSGLQ